MSAGEWQHRQSATVRNSGHNTQNAYSNHVPEVMSQRMAFIYLSTQIILELGQGCGYDVGAYWHNVLQLLFIPGGES